MKQHVNRLCAESAAYIAGIIDGEGTITLTRIHARENRRLVVSTPSFCYAVSSRQALDLLRQVVTYLRSYKRQRAEFALQHYESVTPRNGRYTALQLTERKLFEDRLLSMVPQQRAESLSR